MKHVKDLKYPDVVHIETEKEYDRLASLMSLAVYNKDYKYYLIGNTGSAKKREMYENNYIKYEIYEFSDLIFNEDPLIEEAIRRYPVGTKFFPAHVESPIDEEAYCIITNDTIFQNIGGKIIATVDGMNYTSQCNEIYGNTIYNRVVYDDRRQWATIFPSKTNTEQDQLNSYQIF